MRLLAFDTSTAMCSVAVSSNSGIRISRQRHIREHNRVLFRQIRCILEKADLSFSKLDGIAFGLGPGSFIGVRTTVAVALAFGYAHRLPLVGLSSLEVLAQQAIERCAAKRVLVALDARKDEVYYGYYRAEDRRAVPEGKEGVCALSAIPGLAGFDGVAWGNGFANRAKTVVTVANDQATPTAETMLTLANYRIRHGLCDDCRSIRPVYLRDNIAHPPKKIRE